MPPDLAGSDNDLSLRLCAAVIAIRLLYITNAKPEVLLVATSRAATLADALQRRLS